MSKYETLDRAILNKIGGHPQPLVKINVRDVSDEAKHLASLENGRQPYRIVDGRLQALRKAGKIQFIGKGWIRA